VWHSSPTDDSLNGRRRIIPFVASWLRGSVASSAIDSDLEAIVLKCLSKDSAHRYQSAGDLARDIRRYVAGDAIEAKRDSGWYVLRTYLRRYRLPLGIAVGFAIVLIGGLAGTLAMWQRSEQQRHAAEKRRTEAETAITLLRELLGADYGDSHAPKVPNPTLRQMLDQLARTLPETLSDQPEVEATLRLAIGEAYQSMGEFAHA
jgi:serine/threonine-protein kinase